MRINKSNVKILLVDDHSLIRKGIMAILQKHNANWEIYEASNGIQGIIKAREINPDVILMDYMMPKMDGITASSIIKSELPDCRIILVSMDTSPEVITSTIDAGVMAIIPKDSSDSELLHAIDKVKEGQTHLAGKVSEIATKHILIKKRKKKKPNHTKHPLLTDREVEVLCNLAIGLTAENIAKKLSISRRTLEGHKSNIFRKCQLRSTPDLIRYAVRTKLIEL